MTREDIRLTLSAIAGEGPADGPPASSSSRKLAAVVEDQERRLADLDRRMRVLEPCANREPGLPHLWRELYAPVSCALCGVTR